MCAQEPRQGDPTPTEPEPPGEPPPEPSEPSPEIPSEVVSEPIPPPDPQPHPLEERLSKAEAEVARLKAEADGLRAKVQKTPWLKRLLDAPIIKV